MDCKKIEMLILTDYTDGLLQGGALQEVQGHLASCAKCRRLAGDVASAGKAFKSVKKESAPPGLWNRIKSEIGAARRSPGFAARIPDLLGDFLLRLRPAAIAATAVVMVLFALTSVKLVSYYGAASSVPEQDDIFTIVSSDWNGDGQLYDMGTIEEEYFL